MHQPFRTHSGFYDPPADIPAVKNGSVDIGCDFRGVAHSAGLSYLDVPSEIDLGHALIASQYASPTLQIKRGEMDRSR